MILTKDQVMSILPHREPFLFIDSILSVTLPKKDGESQKSQVNDLKEMIGTVVTASYKTKKDHPIFKGHFPDYPIFPGVLQVEMMAQSVTFIVALLGKDFSELKVDVALLGISDAKFRKPIFPEMELKLVSKVLKIRGAIITSECKVYHDEQLMSECSVLASIKIK